MDDTENVSGATRRQLLQEYSDKKMLFRATTRPYKSRLPFRWSVVNPLGASAVAPAPALTAFAVLRNNQQQEFFSFGIGQSIPFTQATTKISTAGDTNQSSARNTNGQEDFIVESVSATCGGLRVEYPEAAQVTNLFTAVTDDDARAAVLGRRSIIDPGTLLAPPQASSPFNLEGALFEGLKPNASVEFQWDRTGIIPIGTLDQVPEGGARSFLHASGSPDTSNRYRIPEGYAWRAKSRPDGDFVCVVSITDAVVCPINLVQLMGYGPATAGDLNTNATPSFLYLDVTMRVHGLGLSQIGMNA